MTSKSTLLTLMVTNSDACCPAKYIKDLLSEENKVLEERLGISKRTLSYWKRKYYKGTFRCINATDCQLDTSIEGTAEASADKEE